MAEPLPAVVWVMMPLLIAAGAALITSILMQARLEVAVARQREVLVEARALLSAQQRVMEERVHAAEETARRKALDEFMADVRVEQRQFVSERRCLVLEERVCLRNIPLTGWMEHQVPGATAVLTTATPTVETEPPRLLAARATCP